TRLGIAVQSEYEVGAERARFGEVADMAAVQDVEHAVGEDKRPRQRRHARGKVLARAELVEQGCRHDSIVASAAAPGLPRHTLPRRHRSMETRMLVLCGFSLSNYFNKVKMALLEKGVPFTEELVKTGLKDEGTLSASPLGKI